MFAVCLLLCLADPAVSYQADAVRVDALLADLAKQSGQHLACDANVGAEPLIVQFENRQLDEVLPRIAEVAGAEWVKKGDEQRLTRSVSLKRAQEQADLKKLTADIASMQSKAKTAVDAMPVFDDKEAMLTVDRYRLADLSDAQQSLEFKRMSETNPVHRTVVRLIAEIKPEALAKIERGERVVYSDAPTRVQRTLPDARKAVLHDLRSQVSMMEKAKERLGFQQRRSVNYGGLPSIGPGTLANGYSKTILAIKRYGLLINYSFVMVDGKGEKLIDGSGYVPDRTASLMATYPGKGEPIELSPVALAMAALRSDIGYSWAMGTTAKLPDGTEISGSYAMSMTEASGKGPDTAAKEVIGDPVTFDPIGVIAGSLLRQLAKHDGKPLIGTVTDGMALTCADAVNRKQLNTLEDFRAFLLQSSVPETARAPYAVFRDDPDWMVVNTPFPSVTRKARIDRTALRTWIRTIRKTGVLTLADAAKYLVTCPATPTFSTLDMMYVSHADPAIDKAAAESMLTPALPFLASLNPEQWKTLGEKGLPVVALTPAQQNTVRSWVYNEINFGMLRDRTSTTGFGAYKPLTAEPTELFPEGVPPGTFVKVKTKPLLAVVARTKSGFRLILDADSLGFQETVGTAPFPDNTKVPRVVEGYTPATQLRYSVQLLLIPDLNTSFATQESRVVTGAQEVKKEKLPKEYLDRIALAKAAFMRPKGIEVGGRQTKPPQ